MRYFLVTASVAAIALPGTAGNLTPPATPGPTMKTLIDVEPRTAIYATDIPLVISQPGSFYLAESITVPASPGIQITTSGVTIDLNGFAVKGNSDHPTQFDGISSDRETTCVTIRNGFVSDWSGRGMFLVGTASTVENVYIGRNANGIVSNSCRLINCTIEYNRFIGYRHFTDPAPPTASYISGCTVSNNGNNGMSIYQPAIIKDNTFSFNGSNGISVYTSRCRIEGNHFVGNTSTGLYAFKCVVLKNTATGNGTDFDFFPGTTHGPVLSGGAVITSTNPWANISY